MITKELKKLPLSKLIIPDDLYQRLVSKQWVKIKAKNFDILSARELYVTPTDKKEIGYRVIDGGTRLQAALEIGLKEIDCIIVRGITPEQEANIFADQSGKKISPILLFRAKLIAKNPMAIELNNLIKSYGMDVNDGHDNPNRFSAIGTLWGMMVDHHMPIEEVKIAMDFIRDVWEFEDASKHAIFVRATIAYLRSIKYNEEGMEKAKIKLSKVPAIRIIRKADELRAKGHSGSCISIPMAMHKIVKGR